jgi:hypothetical protein
VAPADCECMHKGSLGDANKIELKNLVTIIVFEKLCNESSFKYNVVITRVLNCWMRAPQYDSVVPINAGLSGSHIICSHQRNRTLLK